MLLSKFKNKESTLAEHFHKLQSFIAVMTIMSSVYYFSHPFYSEIETKQKCVMFHKNICQEQRKLSKLNAEKPVITQVKIHIKFIRFKCINTYEENTYFPNCYGIII